jgi:hypothetical protein
MVKLMKFKTLITVMLLCCSHLAASQGHVVSQAYEVALSNFRAPATENGGIAFQECDDCDYMRVRVTSDTRYTVNGKAVRLADFRKVISHVNDRDSVALTVLHHLESDTVEMIAVYL